MQDSLFQVDSLWDVALPLFLYPVSSILNHPSVSAGGVGGVNGLKRYRASRIDCLKCKIFTYPLHLLRSSNSSSSFCRQGNTLAVAPCITCLFSIVHETLVRAETKSKAFLKPWCRLRKPTAPLVCLVVLSMEMKAIRSDQKNLKRPSHVPEDRRLLYVLCISVAGLGITETPCSRHHGAVVLLT